MIRTWPHLRDLACGPRLKLAIFQNREVDAADRHPCEVDADVPVHGGGVRRVGQMPTLLTLNLIDIGYRVAEATIRISFDSRDLATFPPKISVTDIVIVGNTDRRAIANDVAKLQAELNPAGRVFRVAIGLVATKEEYIGIVRAKVVDDLSAWANGTARVAAQVRDHDHFFLHWIAANQSLEHRLLSVAHAVGNILRTIPTFDAKMCIPAGIKHLGFRDFFPFITPLFQFKPRRPILPRLQGKELRAHL